MVVAVEDEGCGANNNSVVQGVVAAGVGRLAITATSAILLMLGMHTQLQHPMLLLLVGAGEANLIDNHLGLHQVLQLKRGPAKAVSHAPVGPGGQSEALQILHDSRDQAMDYGSAHTGGLSLLRLSRDGHVMLPRLLSYQGFDGSCIGRLFGYFEEYRTQYPGSNVAGSC